MRWGLILSITIGITASVVLVRTLFGLPVIMFAIIAACVAFGGGTALTLVLRSPRRP